MIDDPNFPRQRREDTRCFSPEEVDSLPTVGFILDCFHAVQDEFPSLMMNDVKMDMDYSPVELHFYFDRFESDSEYAKRIYYAKMGAERAAQRDTEERERAELARLKAKYER